MAPPALLTVALVGLLVAGLSGCGARPDRHSGTPPAPQAPDGEARAPRIEAGRAGPVALGMTAKEVGALPSLTVLPMDRPLRGSAAPALRVMQFGLPIALVELREDRVWRITVLAETYRTADGAHVGMTARKLEGILGPGEVASGEGNVCATFPGAPGLSFCFDEDADLMPLASGDWSRLAANNPRVRSILVSGAADRR